MCFMACTDPTVGDMACTDPTVGDMAFTDPTVGDMACTDPTVGDMENGGLYLNERFLTRGTLAHSLESIS